jgi:hypothetical protein
MDMYLYVWDIDFASIIDFSIGNWKCSVSVVIFVFNFIYAFMMEAFFRIVKNNTRILFIVLTH